MVKNIVGEVKNEVRFRSGEVKNIVKRIIKILKRLNDFDQQNYSGDAFGKNKSNPQIKQQ